MTYLLLILAWLNLEMVSGHAAYYNPHVMEQVVYVRQYQDTWAPLPKVLPNVDGFIASDDCRDIGQVWFVCHLPAQAGKDRCGYYLVADCCAPRDCGEMRKKGIVLEVDYETATKWNVVGLDSPNIEVIAIRKQQDE